MQFYLSSYKFGNDFSDFSRLLPDNHKLAYIPNAGDPYPEGLTREYDIQYLIPEMLETFKRNNLDIKLDIFDLRDYFDKTSAILRQDLEQYGTVFVRGGNVYVLREAMRRSGFDGVLKSLVDDEVDMLYAGYSAGVCVLAKNLRGIHIMDDLSSTMYGSLIPSTDGIGLLPYLVIPHYDSPTHKETELADLSIAYMEKHKLPYKKLRDGEVLIFDNIKLV